MDPGRASSPLLLSLPLLLVLDLCFILSYHNAPSFQNLLFHQTDAHAPSASRWHCALVLLRSPSRVARAPPSHWTPSRPLLAAFLYA
jgi:hypothetical protein